MSTDFQRTLSRRAALSTLLCGAASLAFAKVPDRSARPIAKPADALKYSVAAAEELIADAKLGGKTSFVVADAQSGEVLETVAPLTSHPPASVTKAMTSLYALKCLSPGHRFRTKLLGNGQFENGVLNGDLILVGGGDPTLDSDDLFEMAARLNAIGLRSITGKFLVYGGVFPTLPQIDPTQPAHVGYNPSVSGLNLNFNRVFFEWKRTQAGYAITIDGRSDARRPPVAFARASLSDRAQPVFQYSDVNGRDNWSVARGALGRGGGRWLPVRRPEIYAGDVFQTAARANGIKLPFPEVAAGLPNGEIIAEHLSPDLQTICRDMMKFSTNLTAEVVGLCASQRRGGFVGLNGSADLMSQWMAASLDTQHASFVDHSGLSDKSRISAREMVRALSSQDAQQVLPDILKPFGMAKSGENAGGAIDVAAKTGTLNFVSGLAGFITPPNGRKLVFAIFASDMARRELLSQAQKEAPRGAKSWNGRAKRMKRELIRRWAIIHGT